MLAIPSVAADVASYPVRRLYNAATGREQAPWFGATPRLQIQDVAAHMAAPFTGETPAQVRENMNLAEDQLREQHPYAATAGDVGADVATLATGRLPFTRAGRPRAFEVLIKKKLAKAEADYPLTTGTYGTKVAAKGAAERSQTMLKFMRGTHRVAEAGAEGAALALLHEQDPLEAAAFTAGAQGILSGVTEGVTRKWINFGGKYGKLTGLALQVAGLTYALHAMGVAAPGTMKDYEAQQTASQKLVAGAIVGMATGMFSGRARSGFVSARVGRDIADAFGSAPRNALQSIILGQLREGDAEGRTRLIQKLELISRNFDKVAPERLRDLNAALGAGGARFLNEIDKITKDLQ